MLDADIKSYHAAEVSSVSTNGGRMSANEIISGVVNNVWPHVPKAERTAGATLHRKVFIKAADDDDGALLAAQQYIDKPTDGDDFIIAFLATMTDTEADITGSERKYGAAVLQANITGNPSTFTVTVEDSTLASGTNAIYADGDTIRLTDKATPDAGSGTEEELTISGAPSVSGNDVTITVAESIVNDYTAGSAWVSSILDKGDTSCSTDTFVDTTAGDGTYDDASYPVITDNIGTVEDAITIQFTDATHFNCTGSSGINYGSHDTGTGFDGVDFAPNNGDFTKPYFTLEMGGFAGTWAAGDTITFNIHPAAFAIWLRRTVPAACASLANNKVTTVTVGESDA